MPNHKYSVDHKRFWLVWSDETESAHGRHDRLESARDHAKRLADENPDCRFAVLCAYEGWQTTMPTVMELRYYDEGPEFDGGKSRIHANIAELMGRNHAK